VATLADPDAPATVPGYVVELDRDRLDDCLALMDEVEDTATDELRRIVITTVDGAAAWAYHFTRPVDGLVRIDAWETVAPTAER
jgi:gamma-glutamylcyclotransferase (GGCT)/AIG2-like uncharacterized protein YtfP